MEIDSFKQGLIKYYGKHDNEYVQKVTIAYVKSHFDSHNYENLLQSIMKSHPVKWGFPDVSAIEDSQDTLFKRENKSYKKVILSKSEWSTNITPLTDEEREEAEPMHDKFLEFKKKMVSKSTDKKLCKDCTYRANGKNSYECRGCIDFSKFSQQEK